MVVLVFGNVALRYALNTGNHGIRGGVPLPLRVAHVPGRHRRHARAWASGCRHAGGAIATRRQENLPYSEHSFDALLLLAAARGQLAADDDQSGCHPRLPPACRWPGSTGSARSRHPDRSPTTSTASSRAGSATRSWSRSTEEQEELEELQKELSKHGEHPELSRCPARKSE